MATGPRYLTVVLLAGQNMKSVHPSRVRRKVVLSLCSQCDPAGGAFGERVSGWTEPKGKTSGIVLFGDHEAGMKAQFPLNREASFDVDVSRVVKDDSFLLTAQLRVRLLKSAVPARSKTEREWGKVLPEDLVDGIKENLDAMTSHCEAEARLPLQDIISGKLGYGCNWVPLRRSTPDGDPEQDALEPNVYLQLCCTPDHDSLADHLKVCRDAEKKRLRALIGLCESGHACTAALMQQPPQQGSQEVYMSPEQVATYQALGSPEEREAYCQELLRLQSVQAGAPAAPTAAPVQQAATIVAQAAAPTSAALPEPAPMPAPAAMIDLMNLADNSPTTSAEPAAATVPAEAQDPQGNSQSSRGSSELEPAVRTELAAAAAPLVGGLDLPTLFGPQAGNRSVKWASLSQSPGYLALDQLGHPGGASAISLGHPAKKADSRRGSTDSKRGSVGGPAAPTLSSCKETMHSMEEKMLAGLGDSLKF